RVVVHHNRSVSRGSLSTPTPQEAFLCPQRQTKAAIARFPPHVIRRAARPNTFPPFNSGRDSQARPARGCRTAYIPLRTGLRSTPARPGLAPVRPVTTPQPRSRTAALSSGECHHATWHLSPPLAP